MGIVVPRSEAETLRKLSGWILIYGRRKTGKSFIVRNFLKYNEYYFISRSGRVYELVGEIFKPIALDVFLDRIQRGVREEKIIVIDEFHRLSSEFQDLLHAIKPEAKAQLLLITSSLFFAEKIIGPRSPLLGIAIPFRVDTIRPCDIIGALANYIREPRELIKISLFAREPLLLGLVHENIRFGDFLEKMLIGLKDIVPALIGEIFFDESREITERYEAILRAVAVGNNFPSKVASYISGIIGEKLSSSDVKSYLRILEKMGLVRRIKIFKRNRYIYTIESPIIHTYYYLNEKIGYGEMDIPTSIAIRETKKIIPKYFEDFTVRLIAETLGGTIEKTQQNEIDGIITRKKETIAVIEVKMGQITPEETKKFIEKTRKLRIKAPKIVIANQKTQHKQIVSLDIQDLIEIAKNPEQLKKKLTLEKH